MSDIADKRRKPERLKKKPIRLTLSQQARENIEARLLNDASLASSISDLLEKIGLEEINVSRAVSDAQTELLRLPISKRLIVLMQEPGTVILSTLSFVVRLSRQLGLDSSKEAVLEVVRKGIYVAFEVGYTFPDRFINNPSALLRWATFYILHKKFLTSEIKKNNPEEGQTSDVASYICLFQINAAIEGIKTASRSHKLEAFKMKAIDGFTISQILMLFQIQDKNFTEEQAYRRIKDGWAIFREHWVKQKPDPSSAVFGGRDVDEIKRYCELVQLTAIDNERQLEDIKILLFRTNNDSFLDLLINEVDYNWYRNRPGELEVLEQLRREIADNLGSWLADKKKEIDEKLLFCRDSEDLARILEQIVRDEIEGQYVPVKALLSKSYPAFKEINKQIEHITSLEDFLSMRQELTNLGRDIKGYSESHSWLYPSTSKVR